MWNLEGQFCILALKKWRNEEMGNMTVFLKPILYLERWFQIKVFEEQLLI